MQSLVICDGYNHPARMLREGLGPLQKSGFSFDYLENAAELSAERMVCYPLVILAKTNNISSTNRNGWMTESIQAAFVDYVQRGNGLLAVHSGTAGWAEMPILRGLLGGVFDHHPPKCRVAVAPRPGHPLTAGCKAFTLRDEHFFMTLDDPQANVFLTTKSEHGEQPGGWRRIQGAGRVCVLTPGHYVETWLHPSFQALLSNVLEWCGNLKT